MQITAVIHQSVFSENSLCLKDIQFYFLSPTDMSEAQFLEPLIKATSPLSRRSSFDAGEIKQEGNKLKLFNGVVIPCMLHILGVLVFLKVSWTVGQAGWLGTLVYCVSLRFLFLHERCRHYS